MMLPLQQPEAVTPGDRFRDDPKKVQLQTLSKVYV